LVYRHAEPFPFDIPECDVDCRDGAVDRGSSEIGKPHHDIPVMLDRAWVLAEQIAGEFCESRGAGVKMTPSPGLAEADETVVGLDAHEKKTVGKDWLDADDLQGKARFCPGCRGVGATRLRGWRRRSGSRLAVVRPSVPED